MNKNRVPTDGGAALNSNPFSSLPSGVGATPAPTAPPKTPVEPSTPVSASKPNRGRVDIVRQTAGRGGKTVTVVSGFKGIGLPEKEALAKRIQKACGCGGSVKDGNIEIQGDQRQAVARVLTEAGFRPVFAGG